MGAIFLAIKIFSRTPRLRLSYSPMNEPTPLHLHLISDSTGQTVGSVARAVLALFPQYEAREHHWVLIHSQNQLERALTAIAETPGPVLYTLTQPELQARLEAWGRSQDWPCIAVLDETIARLSAHLGETARSRPGQQHALDEEYFRRIDAMHFAMELDDGRNPDRLKEAEIILVGVSRSSKTPTSLYLANYGLRVANIPFVPEVELPAALFDKSTSQALIVGLTKEARALGEYRKSRLRSLARRSGAPVANPSGAGADESTTSNLASNFAGSYADQEAIRAELLAARRVFARNGWAVVDVTRRSIEETAAAILALYEERVRTAPNPDSKQQG